MATASYRLPVVDGSPGPQKLPATEVVAARFLSDFQCIAGACEDLCCRDWNIACDEPSYERLREAMSATPAGVQAFAERLALSDGTRPGQGHAYIRAREDGWCGFLQPDRHCGIQARFGEAMLSESCSIFPRTSQVIGDRLELGGSLACPEVARKVLLSREAGELVPASAALMPRQRAARHVERSDDPRFLYFNVIRNKGLSLLGETRVPLAWRLVALAATALKLDALFASAADPASLAAALSMYGDVAALEALGSEYAAVNVAPGSVLQLAAGVLLQRRALPHSERYAALIRKVFESLQAEALGRPIDPAESVPLDSLAAVHVTRSALLEARHSARTDLIFTNYALHFWRGHPQTDSKSLLEHAKKLGMRLAVVRLLFVGHPEIAELLSSPRADADDVIDRVAVEIVQTFVKSFEHAPELVRIVESALDQGSRPSLGQVVCFAKFC